MVSLQGDLFTFEEGGARAGHVTVTSIRRQPIESKVWKEFPVKNNVTDRHAGHTQNLLKLS